MKMIGITGPTGAGKTTALRVLETLGAVIIDADAVYHELLASNAALKAALCKQFGNILDENGEIDRKKLGEIVFEDQVVLSKLNKVAHAFVVAEMEARLSEAEREGARVAAIDAIALIESGFGGRCDVTVAVLAPVEVRVRRIMEREGISEEYARKRVTAQKEDAWFRVNCTYTLENEAGDTPKKFAARALQFFKQILNP